MDVFVKVGITKIITHSICFFCMDSLLYIFFPWSCSTVLPLLSHPSSSTVSLPDSLCAQRCTGHAFDSFKEGCRRNQRHQCFLQDGTRTDPYKWSHMGPRPGKKRPYKLVTGVITPLITGRGRNCWFQ